MASASRRARRVRDWDVWALPRRLLVLLLGVEVTAGAAVVLDVLSTSAAAFVSSLLTSGLLLAASIAHMELALRLERARRRATGGVAHVDMTSAWTFSAALLLPSISATLVIVGLYAYIHWRVDRAAKQPFYRQFYATATIVLAAHGAGAVLILAAGRVGDLTLDTVGVLVLIAALITYTAINMSLIVAAVVLHSGQSVRQVLSGGGDILTEIVTLFLGILIALVMIAAGPWMVFVALGPLLVLHRAVLLRHLERGIRTDEQTGLLNAAGWQAAATRRLRRLRRTGGRAGVLVLDLDHFTAINDGHGRSVGDHLLVAVAAALTAAAGESGRVGRLGGEEFAVLLAPRTGTYSPGALAGEAELMRVAIEELAVQVPTPDGAWQLPRITVSIGGAIYPQHATRLEALTDLADALMREAKQAGRNTVRIAASPAVDEVAHDTRPPGRRRRRGGW